MSDPVQRCLRMLKEMEAVLVSLELMPAPVKPAPPSNRKKLGKQEVKSIRDLKRIGCSNKEIADVFDVHPSTVGRIVKGVYHR
jgi:DNA-binding NarL/FixJ family response regulator